MSPAPSLSLSAPRVRLAGTTVTLHMARWQLFPAVPGLHWWLAGHASLSLREQEEKEEEEEGGEGEGEGAGRKKKEGKKREAVAGGWGDSATLVAPHF